jgi:hypothetical protein
MYSRISIFDFDGTIINNEQENVPDGWRETHGRVVFDSELSRKEVEDTLKQLGSRSQSKEQKEELNQKLFDNRRDKNMDADSFYYSLFCYRFPGVAWMQDPGSVVGPAAMDVVDSLHKRIRDTRTFVVLMTARSEDCATVVLDRLAEPDVGVSYDDFDEVHFKKQPGSSSEYKRSATQDIVSRLDNEGNLVNFDELVVEVFEDLRENIDAIRQGLSSDGIEVVGNPGVEIEDSTERKEARRKRQKKLEETGHLFELRSYITRMYNL